MKRILLFPFNEDTKVVATNISENYKVVAIAAYKEDKRRLEEFQKETGIVCSYKYTELLDEVDMVVFAQKTMGQDNCGYKERIESALHKGKDICISKRLFDELGIAMDSHINFIEDIIELQIGSGEKLKEIAYPIISIMGLGENCGKFILQSKIYNYLRSRGVNVLSICSNVLGNFIHMETLPYFMFSENISLVKKIEGFNEWLFDLAEKEKPDLILLGYPGGILPFNELERNYYSEISLAVSNAVISDVGILSVYKSFNKNEDAINSLKQLCLMKYNIEPENFVVCENYYKTNFEERKTRYYKDTEKIFSEEASEKKGEFSSVFINDNENLTIQIDNIVSKLENNFFFI